MNHHNAHIIHNMVLNLHRTTPYTLSTGSEPILSIFQWRKLAVYGQGASDQRLVQILQVTVVR